MVRLFNFVRNELITDISGNIYDYATILSIISKLSCFGLTLEQLIIKKTFPPNIHKIKNKYYKSIKCREKTYDDIETKYEFIILKYNELNPNSNNFGITDSLFEIQSHYTDEQIQFFKTEYENYKKDMMHYYELENIADKAIEEFNDAFHINKGELWKEIVFFKFVKIIHKNKYLVEVVSFLHKQNLKSGLKIGDQITINPLDINYVNPMDKILKKYQDKENIDIKIIPLNLPCVTDWIGRSYRNRDTVTQLLEEGNVVRIQINIENKVQKNVNPYCWYMEIIKYDSNKEWFIGLSLSNFKHFDEYYDYEQPMKVNCLYYFHKNSILEIPLYEDEPNYVKLKKEIIKTQCRMITGSVYNESEIEIELEDVLSKFI